MTEGQAAELIAIGHNLAVIGGNVWWWLFAIYFVLFCHYLFVVIRK